MLDGRLGFQAWAGGDAKKPIVTDVVKQCFECHQPKKDQDYVYSRTFPERRLEFGNTAQEARRYVVGATCGSCFYRRWRAVEAWRLPMDTSGYLRKSTNSAAASLALLR